MPEIHTYTTYKFEELSDEAKENAIRALKEINVDGGFEWWDTTVENAADIADMLGINTRVKRVKRVDGTYGYLPAIYFSGFWSQGDGACFEGSYQYKKGSVKAVKEEMPHDIELHRIAEGLAEVQKLNFYQIKARVSHHGRYSHSMSTTIDVSRKDGQDFVHGTSEQEVKDLLRSFMDWIYQQLESEYEYLLDDEQVKDSIIANGYDFHEDGTQA